MQVVRSNNIPGTAGTTWASAVANWLDRPVTNITTTPRQFQRLYLVDPNITLTLPYTQSGNSGLAAAPSNARVMVVSSIARTNVPPTIDFNETWNWNNVLSPTAMPASWSSFPGNGEDVCIQRINLGQMFYQLVLVNRDQSGVGATNAPFAMNGTATPTIITNLLYPNGQIWNKYYLAGSVLGLCGTNGGVASTFILNRNAGFVFENGSWNAQILGCAACTNSTPPSLASAYNAAAINFFNSLWNPAAGTNGATQTAVLSAFGNLMSDYIMWSEATSNGIAMPFNTDGVGNNPNRPILQILDGEQTSVDTYTGTLQTNNNVGLLH